MTKPLAILLIVCMAIALVVVTWYGVPGWTLISIGLIIGMSMMIKNYLMR